MTDEKLLRNIGGIKAETKELRLFRINNTLREQQTKSGVIRLSRALVLESDGVGISGFVVTYNDETYTFEHGKNAQRKFERLIDKHIFNR